MDLSDDISLCSLLSAELRHMRSAAYCRCFAKLGHLRALRQWLPHLRYARAFVPALPMLRKEQREAVQTNTSNLLLLPSANTSSH